MRYFRKELADQPVYVNGHPVRFDILETGDPALIAEMENCIRRNSGGIYEITAEQFADELKKKELGNPSENNSKPQHRRQELSALQFGNPGAAAASRFARQQVPLQAAPPASHPMPDPIEVPTAASFSIPPTAKLKDLKEMAERARPK